MPINAALQCMQYSLLSREGHHEKDSSLAKIVLIVCMRSANIVLMKLARTLAQLDNSISYKNVKQQNCYYDILLYKNNFGTFIKLLFFFLVIFILEVITN